MSLILNAGTPGEWRVLPDTAVQADATSYISNAQRFLGRTGRFESGGRIEVTGA